MSALTPFQKHLSFFATPSTAWTNTPRITLSSGLRRALALGLNFPLACLTAVTLRIVYGDPRALWTRPVDVRAVTLRRTQLEDIALPTDRGREGVTVSDVLSAVRAAGLGVVDLMHVAGMVGVGADGRTGLLSGKDVEATRQGTLLWEVEKRRRWRRGPGGEGDVLPFWRGGPLSVAGHAWFVERLYGVRVYQVKGTDG